MSLYMQGLDKIRDARWKRIVDLKLMQGKPALSPRGVVPERADPGGPQGLYRPALR